jgi:hypothetical protein
MAGHYILWGEAKEGAAGAFRATRLLQLTYSCALLVTCDERV